MTELSQADIKNISLNLKEDIINFRKSSKLATKDTIFIDSSLQTGGEISVDTRQIWAKIIQSKLEIVNILGGSSLANKIVLYMYDFDKEFDGEERYNFVAAFDHLATHVIDGWYM